MPRLRVLLLVLTLALLPLPAAAQVPPRAPAAPALADLFGADVMGYAEVQWRPPGEQGARLDQLLALFRAQPEFDAHYAWLGMIPELTRALAVGVTPRGDSVEVQVAALADEPAILLSLLLLTRQVPPPAGAHAGVPIYTINFDQSGPPVHLATVDRFLLAASTETALARLIDRARAGASAEPGLAASARFRESLARLPANRLATAYFDTGALLQWIEADGPMPDRAGMPPARPGRRTPGVGATGGLAAALAGLGATLGEANSRAAQGVLQRGGQAVGLVADADGFRLISTQPVAESSALAAMSSRGGALDLIPANALVAITSSGIGPTLSDALASSGISLDQMRTHGVDWQRDVLSWMDGEFGVAVWPAEPGSRPVGGFALPTVALFFEVRDPPSVEASLRTVTAVLAREARNIDEPVEVRQGDTLVRRLALAEGLELTWGYLGRWLFITTGSAPPIAAAAASGGLAASPAYQRVARQLPSPNGGVTYVDIPALASWLEGLQGSPLAGARGAADWWRPLLGPLGALASTSRYRAGWLEQVTLLEVRR